MSFPYPPEQSQNLWPALSSTLLVQTISCHIIWTTAFGTDDVATWIHSGVSFFFFCIAQLLQLIPSLSSHPFQLFALKVSVAQWLMHPSWKRHKEAT